MNMPLPTNAKITALVCNGRSRPKVVNCRLRFAAGQNICVAASKPATMPTRPQITVAIANARTMLLSYLKVSTWAPNPPPVCFWLIELFRLNTSLILD